MTKINQADLKREIEAQNRKDSRKKFFNVNALRISLDAAKEVKDTESFAKTFTPSRGNNAIARKLKLGLDVKRGRWVLDGDDRADLNRLTRESKMTQVNEAAVDGKKLIELLMQALEEGDALKVSEYTNQMLSQKVSECLQDHRVMIAEQLFTEDLADLVKVSNLNRNKDTDSSNPEDEQLPNMELAQDGEADDDTFDEARKPSPRFEVGEKVDVETGDGKFTKGTVTKVGPRQLDGVWVKSGSKTTNWPIGLVRKLKEGSESEGLDTFRS